MVVSYVSYHGWQAFGLLQKCMWQYSETEHDFVWYPQVTITFSNKNIAKSPFTVTVEGAAGDASKVTVKGPGVEKTGVVATKKTYFEVFCKGEGRLLIVICILRICQLFTFLGE